MTSIGAVPVRQPRVRGRGAAGSDPRRIRFTPAICRLHVAFEVDGDAARAEPVRRIARACQNL